MENEHVNPSEDWIVDSSASHHYINSKKHIKYCNNEDGNVFRALSQRLPIEEKGIHEKLRALKCFPTIGRKFLSVGQLTQDTDVKVLFEKGELKVYRWKKIITKRGKGNDFLSRTRDASNISTLKIQRKKPAQVRNK